MPDAQMILVLVAILAAIISLITGKTVLDAVAIILLAAAMLVGRVT